MPTRTRDMSHTDTEKGTWKASQLGQAKGRGGPLPDLYGMDDLDDSHTMSKAQCSKKGPRTITRSSTCVLVFT